MAAARELVIADEPAAWAALGFAPGAAFALGGVVVRLVGSSAGGGIVELRIEGVTAERPDGLPLVASAGRGGAPPPSSHPNGALAIDHVVAFTDDLDRTSAALERAGAPLRRRAEPRPGTPMAFHRLGPLIVELVQSGARPRLWGFVVVVSDLDACAGPLVGTPRPAVQPGRRIAMVRPEAGLPVALAFMTPQPRRAAAVGD
jgi:hypothetical protein